MLSPGFSATFKDAACANYILENDPSKRVVYVTSEKFTNEIVEAVRGSNNDHSQSLKAFREKYRENVDVLLIDDIQFIIGKEATQQEFFFTFSLLTDSKKQDCHTGFIGMCFFIHGDTHFKS